MSDAGKKDLFGLTLPQLQNIVTEAGLPKFTASQIADWLYKKRCLTIEDMTNISKKGRDLLSESYYIGRVKPSLVQKSKDGTKKYLFPVGDGKSVESVYIPENDRSTLCISSQIGCQMGCEFCATGKQGFSGNLTSGEIINQIFSIDEFESLTNIVYMGMGEPLNNTDNVLDSIDILTSKYGLAWSPKRITLSTVGIIPSLKRFLDSTTCHLAISLHIPYPTLREKFMPAEKAYPITDVIALLKEYDWSGQRRVSFEYTMFQGVNDSESDIKALCRLLSGIPCRVNIIPYHSIDGSVMRPASENAMENAAKMLEQNKITATIRRSRGQDIEAACGMLAKTKNL